MEDKLIRLSDAETLLRAYADQCHGIGKYEKASGVLSAIKHLVDIPGLKPNVVTQAEYDILYKKYQTLLWLLNGEWVECEDVQQAMNITFKEGLQRFDFGRMVRWNKPPKNGQFVSTKFRLCDKSIQTPKEFWNTNDVLKYNEVNSEGNSSYHFDDFDIEECSVHPESNPDSHQIELVIEQQGGIL